MPLLRDKVWIATENRQPTKPEMRQELDSVARTLTDVRAALANYNGTTRNRLFEGTVADVYDECASKLEFLGAQSVIGQKNLERPTKQLAESFAMIAQAIRDDIIATNDTLNSKGLCEIHDECMAEASERVERSPVVNEPKPIRAWNSVEHAHAR